MLELSPYEKQIIRRLFMSEKNIKGKLYSIESACLLKMKKFPCLFRIIEDLSHRIKGAKHEQALDMVQQVFLMIIKAGKHLVLTSPSPLRQVLPCNPPVFVQS